MSEAVFVQSVTLKPRKKREVYDKTLWRLLVPSSGLSGLAKSEACSLVAWGKKQGWGMGMEKEKTGRYTVGRIE